MGWASIQRLYVEHPNASEPGNRPLACVMLYHRNNDDGESEAARTTAPRASMLSVTLYHTSLTTLSLMLVKMCAVTPYHVSVTSKMEMHVVTLY